jgi:hypothetical protein
VTSRVRWPGPFPPVLVVLRAQSRLGLEGRTRTLSGPSADLSAARVLAFHACTIPRQGLLAAVFSSYVFVPHSRHLIAEAQGCQRPVVQTPGGIAVVLPPVTVTVPSSGPSTVMLLRMNSVVLGFSRACRTSLGRERPFFTAINDTLRNDTTVVHIRAISRVAGDLCLCPAQRHWIIFVRKG